MNPRFDLEALKEEAIEQVGDIEGLIYLAFRGSVAHGTYVPDTDPLSIDDVDLMGVVVPSLEHYMGLRQWGSRGTKEVQKGKWDVVLYEARKMLSLLRQGNPNVLSALFCQAEHVILMTEAGETLRNARNIFLSKAMHNSFAGYANSQLQRMTKFAFGGHLGEKRKRLVEQFGYDTKNAAHAIRLLKMAGEVFRTGYLRVYRHADAGAANRRRETGGGDAEELLAIKRGSLALEEVQAMAEGLFTDCREALKRSPLPDEVDDQGVNTLCVNVVLKGLGIDLLDPRHDACRKCPDGDGPCDLLRDIFDGKPYISDGHTGGCENCPVEQMARRAANAIPEGLEIVECPHCWEGKQIVSGEHPAEGTWEQDCPFCNGTGKVLQKKGG